MSWAVILLILVLLAGFYMAWNIGANDVANAMGTSVGSGALTMRQAVMVAAVLEFSGAFFLGSHVTETVQKGIIDLEYFAKDEKLIVYGMLASLLAAGLWLQIASYFGWPVSTTHSIVGAVIGFGAIIGGWEAVHWDKVTYIVSSWLLSPLIGGIMSYGIFNLLRRKIFYTSNPVEAAKRATPYLVFVVIGTLALVLLYKGVPVEYIDLSFLNAFGISVIIGLFGAGLGAWYVRQLPSISLHAAQTAYGPEVAVELDKAKKHLKRIQTLTSGETRYHLSLLLEEVEDISSSFKENVHSDHNSSQYQIVEKIFGYLQIITACLMAFAHGANDVANATGPLAAAVGVLTYGIAGAEAAVPTWGLVLGGFGIVLGLATWGWRVMDTIGKKITELTPSRGFTAEFGAALTILVASRLGMPISSTHTLVGAVFGVALARGMEALNLSTSRDIILSWAVTIPAAASISVGLTVLLRAIFS